MLNSDSWDGHFRRLAVGDRVVRAGWFATVDAAVVIATTEQGMQIDLLVVPPGTGAAAAEAAMATAADPANRLRAPAILAERPAADGRPGAGDSQSVWDNEGGHGAGPAVR